MEDKISIVLEAVERAKGVLNQTIADIEKLDNQNKKSESTWQRLNGVLKDHDKILLGIKVGATAVLAATLLMARAAIRTADSYLVMSQAAGTTVETFSTLVFAAGQANVQVNELVIGMKQLQIAAVNASQGSADQAAAFKALGVEFKNADGTIKSSTELLFLVSDAFAAAKDGPVKAAIAQRLFGRSSQELIGFLNQGSVAIQEQQKQAKALGLEISTKTAKAADQFSDNMNALKGVLQGLANQVVAALLPALIQVQQFLLANPTIIKAVTIALIALSAALVTSTIAWNAFRIAGQLSAATLGVGEVKNAKDYASAIRLLAATPWVAYTAGIAGAVAIIYAGVEAWRLYKAAQEEATSENRLLEQNARIDNDLKAQIKSLREAGKITEEESTRINRALSQAFLANGPEAEAQAASAQRIARNLIRKAQGQEPIGRGPAGTPNAPKELALPDPALEKAKLDANDKVVLQAIENRVQDFAQGQKREQFALDDSLRRRTITLDEWRKQQLALDEKQAVESKKIEDFKFSIAQENIRQTMALSSDPKEVEALKGEQLALEIGHQQRLYNIDAEGAQQRLLVTQKFFDNQKALTEENLSVIQQQSAGAGADFQSALDAIQVGEEQGKFVDVFAAINMAKDEYLVKLAQEQEALAAILTTMDAINAQQPGTFAQADKEKVSKAISENQKEQVKAEERTTQAKKGLQAKQLQGTQDMFGNMAEAAKAFGKEGFAAYKALAIAQAVVNTASAAIGAYNSVVGIPYVGPILAPIAAAAAIAAGAAQISIIAGQKYARGGLIDGPGGGTDDQVPILASNREFMVRNAVVEQPGALQFLRDFNAMGMDAIDAEFIPTAPRAARFAVGGLIGDAIEGAQASRAGSGGGMSVGFLDTRNHFRRFMRQEGTKIVVDGMRQRGNQVVA